jgi:Ca2+-binding EF-hand superfamily protein
LTAEAFAPFDYNRDGALDIEELVAMLANPPAAVDLKITLFHKKRGRPDVVRMDEATTRRPGTLLSLPLAGIGFQWRAAASAAAAASDNRNFYKIKFRQADGDKNGYLDANEFGALGLPNATFEAVDRDGDKQVFVEEVVTYADQDSTAAQHRVVMTVANEGKSLFEALDADSDRRLSRRELSHSVDRLRSFDRDGDGRITPAELSGQYRVTLGLGKPSLFADDRQNMQQLPTDPIINEPRVGPPWHRKMDRNRDGDVSWLEFLGPREQFTKLDTDDDGLISVREAEALESADNR